MTDPDHPPFTLYATDLWQKSGFRDGDLLDAFLWEAGIEARSHAALIAVVRRYLLPALPYPVEVDEIATTHNPIRARDEGEYPAPVWAANISVVVTGDQVLAAIRIGS